MDGNQANGRKPNETKGCQEKDITKKPSQNVTNNLVTRTQQSSKEHPISPRFQDSILDVKKPAERIDTPLVIKTPKPKVITKPSSSKNDSKQKNINSKHMFPKNLDVGHRNSKNRLRRNEPQSTKLDSVSKHSEELDLSETDYTLLKQIPASASQEDLELFPSEREIHPSEQKIDSREEDILGIGSASSPDLEQVPLPSLWGVNRTDIQTEFPNKPGHVTRPRPVQPCKVAMDLREGYENFMPPSDLVLTEAHVVCELFSEQRRFSIQEAHPWTAVAEQYVHEISESVQRKQFAPVKRSKYGLDGKSRRMRIQELRTKALQNIVHHNSFNEIKAKLVTGTKYTSNDDNAPALLVHNGISFVKGVREEVDYSGETISERQDRLRKEQIELKKKKLHDLEVIFDTEVIMPDRSLRLEDVEIETAKTDYEEPPANTPFNDQIAETFWALVKIDLHKDGSKVYEIKKPCKDKPNCPIPEATHRHFVVSPHDVFN